MEKGIVAMSTGKQKNSLYSDVLSQAPTKYQMLYFLNDQMPRLLTQEKAVKLELELRQADELKQKLKRANQLNRKLEEIARQGACPELELERNKDPYSRLNLKDRKRAIIEDSKKVTEAYAKLEKLLEAFIMDQADMSILMSIKLYTDIFNLEKTQNPTVSLDSTDEKICYDFLDPASLEEYKREVLEISKKNPIYFMTTYCAAVRPSNIQALDTYSSYETAQRKLYFISRKISNSQGNDKLIKLCKSVLLSLFNTPMAYNVVMLSIIDLHHKMTTVASEKELIDQATSYWIETLKWDTEHLKKHTKKPQQFFIIANNFLKRKTNFKEADIIEITSIQLLAQALDLRFYNKYNLHVRKKLLNAIETEWRAWKRANQPSTKPASNSKPKKKTYFKVNLTCHALLTDGTINKTQPLSIKTVIEFLSSNSKAALKDYQPCSDTPPTKDADIKPIGVHIDKATSNKVKTLQKRFKFSAVHHLLEFAVKYYEQNKGKPVASPEQNASNHKQKPEPSHNSTTSEAVAGEQLPDTNQADKPNETEEQTNPPNDAQHAENALQTHKTCPLVFSIKTILLLQNPELAFRPPSAISNLVIASVEDNSKTSDQQTQRATPLRCSPPKD